MTTLTSFELLDIIYIWLPCTTFKLKNYKSIAKLFYKLKQNHKNTVAHIRAYL